MILILPLALAAWKAIPRTQRRFNFAFEYFHLRQNKILNEIALTLKIQEEYGLLHLTIN